MKKFIFIMLFIAGVTIGVTFASAAYAIDVTMGSGGNLVFEPNEVTISAGDTVHFINNSLPPHNIIVESRPDLSRDHLCFHQVNLKTLFLLKQETMSFSAVLIKVLV